MENRCAGANFPSPLVGEGGSARSAETDEGCWKKCDRAEAGALLKRCVPSSTPHPPLRGTPGPPLRLRAFVVGKAKSLAFPGLRPPLLTPQGEKGRLRRPALRYGSGRSSLEKPNRWLFLAFGHHSSPHKGRRKDRAVSLPQFPLAFGQHTWRVSAFLRNAETLSLFCFAQFLMENPLYLRLRLKT